VICRWIYIDTNYPLAGDIGRYHGRGYWQISWEEILQWGRKNGMKEGISKKEENKKEKSR
jgi:hypothetical protein